jgi:hypothetical protein
MDRGMKRFVKLCVTSLCKVDTLDSLSSTRSITGALVRAHCQTADRSNSFLFF